MESLLFTSNGKKQEYSALPGDLVNSLALQPYSASAGGIQ